MSETNYGVVVLDWDGCIAKTLHCWLGEFRQAFNNRDLWPSDQDISSRFGQWDRVAELGIDVTEVASFNSSVRAVAEQALKCVELYPGAKDFLVKMRAARLAGRFGGVALLTGSYDEAIQDPITYHELNEIFDVIVSKSHGLREKPDPEGIVFALESMGLNIDDVRDTTVMIGDTDKDILAARAAGVDSIFFNPPNNLEVYGPDQIDYFKSLRPTHEVTSFYELEQLILTS